MSVQSEGIPGINNSDDYTITMPINTKGGKGCKKGKNANNDFEPEMVICNEDDSQMYGRVMASLGSRRFKVFCNDNKERICKVCGAMRKSDWIEKGALVLIGLRNLSMVLNDSDKDKKGADVGDIIGLIDTRLYGKMKKIEGINPLLFTDVENMDKGTIKKRIDTKNVEDDDMFEREGEKSDDDEGEGDEEERPLTVEERATKKRKEEMEIKDKRNAKYKEDEVNIDDI
jgi:initiation factor 1A